MCCELSKARQARAPPALTRCRCPSPAAPPARRALLCSLPAAEQIMQSITETFGRRIWQKTLLVLTHGNLPMPPPGTSFGEWPGARISNV